MTNYNCPCDCVVQCRQLTRRSLSPLPCETDYAGEPPAHHGTRMMPLGKVQRDVLRTLQRYGELNMRNLCDAMGVTRQAVQDTVEKLERRGLVHVLRIPSKTGKLARVKYAAATDRAPEQIRVRY